MKCNNCNREVPENTAFCPDCGADLTIESPKENNSNMKKILPVIITAIICLAIGIGVTFAFMSRDNTEEPTETTVSQSEDDSTQDTDPTESESGSTQNSKSGTTKRTPSTSAIISNKLYRPEKSKFCNQYQMYVSGNSAGQGYAKMRFGPNKYNYNVVGQISNGSVVTVQTKSVNGWTLIYCEGKEGWVRTDFLYSTYADCFDKTPVRDTTSKPNNTTAPDNTFEPDNTPEPDNTTEPDTAPEPDNTTEPDNTPDPGDTFDDPPYEDPNEDGSVSEVTDECNGAGDKPVLYLYPEKETDIDVKVSLNNMYFTCTYPEYGNGWSVTAKPDGTLINKKDNKEYSYLYWELGGKPNYDFSKGFVVKGSDTADFLQEALSEMGLTPREYNEFIVYWLPKMQNNEYNLISFQNEEYTDNVRLDISPKPDSTLRIFMAYKALDEEIEVEPQEFEPFERKGFTVVEWGGAQVK